MRKQISLIILSSFTFFVLTFNLSNAQDAVFSQFYSAGLYLNPAMAGAKKNLTFSSNYRSQWRSVVIPYRTSQLSIIYPLMTNDLEEKHKGGIGLSFYNDAAGGGNLQTNGLNINFSYNVPLTANQDHIVSLGFQGGIMQRAIDPTNLKWGEQFNPYIGFDAQQMTGRALENYNTMFPDFSAGFIYHYNANRDFITKDFSGFLGMSSYHINKPNESLVPQNKSKLPRLFKIHGGIEYRVNNKLHLSPNVLAAMQNDVYQYNAGIYFSYQLINRNNPLMEKTNLIMGGWYRFNESAIALLGLDNPYYTLGFSYDYNTSSFRRVAGGGNAFEISLTIRKLSEEQIKKFSTPRI